MSAYPPQFDLINKDPLTTIDSGPLHFCLEHRSVTNSQNSQKHKIAFGGWSPASSVTAGGLKRVRNKYNIPVIIKYPFWQMTAKGPNATYACINQGQAVCPREIERQSVCINADIGQLLQSLSDTAIQ